MRREPLADAPGFVRIRHYGLLASAHVRAGLARACGALEPAPASEPPTEPDAEVDDDELLVETACRLCGLDLRRCPECAHRAMQLGAASLPRGPPC